MKDQLFIAVVLDRSGSMQSVAQATIDGFNEFVEKQKTQKNTLLELFQFDDQYEVVFTPTPISDVPKLTDKTFVPRGMTALHDAMGKTIDDVGEYLRNIPERNRPGKVLIAVITDGGENSSTKYNNTKVAELIKHQQSKYNWDFVFIGANQDAVLTAKGFGLGAQKSLTYTANAASTKGVFAGLARYSINSGSISDPARYNAFTEQDKKEANQQ